MTADAFAVRLANFEGPFDLLLSLIAKHKLDVTEVALARVTDDFLAHMRAHRDTWELGQASMFLVVAATLLDLKASRLLPKGAVEDEEDLELLAERDLLFARLLEYRAFRSVAEDLAQRYEHAARCRARTAEIEERFARLLPEVVLAVGAEQLRDLAAAAMSPRAAPVVDVAHLHLPRVSVTEQVAVLRARLTGLAGPAGDASATFEDLVSDCEEMILVVGRFLALLELYREGAVAFEQDGPLQTLTVRWTGRDQAALPAPRDAGEEWD